MNRPDPDLDTLGPIPRGNDGPVFAEPWQAEAFALVLKLAEEERFTWPEWAAALSDEIARARAAGGPDDGGDYYERWLAALETLLARKGLVEPGDLSERKNAWAEAYARTPHGEPVRLSVDP